MPFREFISSHVGRHPLFNRAPVAVINPITLAIIVAFSTLALPQTARASCNNSGGVPISVKVKIRRDHPKWNGYHG